MQEVAGSGPVYRSSRLGKVRARHLAIKDGLGESNSSGWLREQPRYIPDTSCLKNLAGR